MARASLLVWTPHRPVAGLLLLGCGSALRRRPAALLAARFLRGLVLRRALWLRRDLRPLALGLDAGPLVLGLRALGLALRVNLRLALLRSLRCALVFGLHDFGLTPRRRRALGLALRLDDLRLALLRAFR